jgi:hypothetical protein
VRRNSPFNYVLRPGDSIQIPRVDNLISIVGTGHRYAENAQKIEVNVPYTPGRSARFYVKEYALGFTKKADRKALYVEYPNGKVDKTVNWLLAKNYPTVKKGGTIYIDQKLIEEKTKDKREQKPFDMNQAVATVTAALTSFATLYVLLTR